MTTKTTFKAGDVVRKTNRNSFFKLTTGDSDTAIVETVENGFIAVKNHRYGHLRYHPSSLEIVEPAPKPSIIHTDEIKKSVANTAMATRTLMVQLWIMGSHVKRLMDEHLMYPDDIAAQTGVNKTQLYSALTVRETYAKVQDIPA